MKLIDAHSHLHDSRLEESRSTWLPRLMQAGTEAVVNGTCEKDWPEVRSFVRENTWARAAYGIHPWYVSQRSGQWFEALCEMLDEDPAATIGEVGLDRWIEGYDFPAQQEVFARQLALAREREIVITVHCLEAWGALEEMTRAEKAPRCGWLIHSFGGSAEMARTFVERGAFFSFSGYFLHERKHRQREVFRALPLERLLVETDAPDMPPPAGAGAIFYPGEKAQLNSPENLELCYRGLAGIREMPVEELAGQVAANFVHLFGGRTREVEGR